LVKLNIEPVRGMRDVIPPESKFVEILIRRFEDVARKYGYEPVIPPIIERFELFALKSGPEIRRSMYVFKDKAGREVCLRPEFTASIARIYLKHFLPKPKPIKLYYVGPAFRYEEPQLGRYREFIQVGVENIGDHSVYSDIELLLILRDYYRSIGLSGYTVRIGNVGVMRGLFTRWGIQEDVQDVILHLIDKRRIDDVQEILKRYADAELDVISYLMGVRTTDPDELEQVARKFSKYGDVMNEVARLSKLLKVTRAMGINTVADLGFARGLAYYTGFIFEVTVPSLNVSIGGGGRYDTLIKLYGGPQTPATGFSLGVERTYLALKASDSLPEVGERRVMLISLIDDYTYVDRVSEVLRSQGLAVNTRFTTLSKLGDALGVASRMMYDYVAIIGDKEFRSAKVTIKDLRKREQRTYSIKELGEGESIWI